MSEKSPPHSEPAVPNPPLRQLSSAEQLLLAARLVRWSPSCAARLGEREADLCAALDLVDGFPGELRSVVKRDWDKNPNADSRTQIMIPSCAIPTTSQTSWRTTWLMELPRALGNVGGRAPSRDGRTWSWTVRSRDFPWRGIQLHDNLWRPPTCDFRSAAFKARRTNVGSTLCVLQMPRIEGSGVQRWPILLGHEATHVAVRDKGAVVAYHVWSKFDVSTAEGLPNPRAGHGAPPIAVARGLYRIAQDWATELLCDAHALFRYSPAAIPACEYFVSIGAVDSPAAPSSWRIADATSHRSTRISR